MRVTECLHLASAHFGKTFPEIPVKFDLAGTVGGYFCVHTCRTTGKVSQYFRFNRVLARENLNEYLEQICPHEVAHYIALCQWGRDIRPHGVEWKSVMVDVFNLAPDRCHAMNTAGVENIPFVYRCATPAERALPSFVKTRRSKKTSTSSPNFLLAPQMRRSARPISARSPP